MCVRLKIWQALILTNNFYISENINTFWEGFFISRSHTKQHRNTVLRVTLTDNKLGNDRTEVFKKYSPMNCDLEFWCRQDVGSDMGSGKKSFSPFLEMTSTCLRLQERWNSKLTLTPVWRHQNRLRSIQYYGHHKLSHTPKPLLALPGKRISNSSPIWCKRFPNIYIYS